MWSGVGPTRVAERSAAAAGIIPGSSGPDVVGCEEACRTKEDIEVRHSSGQYTHRAAVRRPAKVEARQHAQSRVC